MSGPANAAEGGLGAFGPSDPEADAGRSVASGGEPASDGESVATRGLWATLIQSPTELLAVVAVAGGVAYGALRVVYAQYFAEFGLEPEDVGLGQTEILRQSLLGPGLLALALVAFVMFVVVAVLLVANAVVGARGELAEVDEWVRKRDAHRTAPESSPPQPPRTVQALAASPALRGHGEGAGHRFSRWKLMAEPEAPRATLRTVLLRHRGGDAVIQTTLIARRRWWLFLLASFLAAFTLLSHMADQAARRAQIDGETTHVIDWELGPLRLPVLDIQAVAAQVRTLDESVALPDGVRSSCLLYLGRTESDVTLYNASNRKTYRVPSEGVVVELSTDIQRLPSRCSE